MRILTLTLNDTCNPDWRVLSNLLLTICKGLLSLACHSNYRVTFALNFVRFVICTQLAICLCFVIWSLGWSVSWVWSVPTGLVPLKQQRPVVSWVCPTRVPSEFSLPGHRRLLHTCTCHTNLRRHFLGILILTTMISQFYSYIYVGHDTQKIPVDYIFSVSLFWQPWWANFTVTDL